jgi:transcriptional regulator with XRE-family HTH domain
MPKTSQERYRQVLNPQFKRLGKRIETYRLKKGFSTKESLAYSAGISIYYYYRMIKGTANISLLQLIKLCETLDIKVRDLLDF